MSKFPQTARAFEQVACRRVEEQLDLQLAETLIVKDEMDDLDPKEKRALRAMLKMELDARR